MVLNQPATAAVYGVPSSTVNDPFAGLSEAVLSTYRWLYRWWRQTGDVHPSTPYLAAKQRKSERTIYRRLAVLRSAGLIDSEVDPGISRTVTPLAVPPPLKRRPGPAQRPPVRGGAMSHSGAVVSGVMSGVVSGVTPYRALDAVDAVDATTTAGAGGDTPPCGAGATGPALSEDLVSEVVAVGVVPPVARRLIREQGEEQVRSQLSALAWRPARDRAAVLVKAVREAWRLPAGMIETQERKRTEAAERERRAARAALAQKQRDQDAARRVALEALPAAERQAIEQEALRIVQERQGATWGLVAGRPAVLAALVRDQSLKLISSDQ